MICLPVTRASSPCLELHDEELGGVQNISHIERRLRGLEARVTKNRIDHPANSHFICG
jgi:hypothetical protein